MHIKLLAGVAFSALLLPASAFAQSTATAEFEEGEDIVVTGTREQSVGGIETPDTPKAKVQIDSELIQRQRPGQTVNEIINLVPGVSFQGNDPYGSGGGGFRIRGFDSSRISQTLDGIPLNDTGNYAIYTNQQQDSETLESVTVNLGATDVDSPTASAVGGTINIQTRTPGDDLGALFSASYGDFEYNRVFGMIDTGDFTGLGTKAFVSGSWTTYDNPFNNYGKIRKQQFNGRLFQELGSNGDFISVAGHYNENRNNFFGSAPLRDDGTRLPGTGSGNRFPRNFDEAIYTVNYPCTVAAARPGAADTTNSCGTEFDRRFNPSNTGNIRGQSRFTLADGLILTVEPSYQYTKANGGGTITGREEVLRRANGQLYTGYIGNAYYFGRDLNGDGRLGADLNGDGVIQNFTRRNPTTGRDETVIETDQVTLLSPSQTNTNRYLLNNNLLWTLDEQNSLRFGYLFERAKHRQTGEVGFVEFDGDPVDVFPVNDPILDVDGNVIQKRDRKSFTTLHQLFGQYRGEFLGDRLVLDAGLRVPFFKRELDQNCFTTSAGGFVDCVPFLRQADYAAQNPNFARPQQRDFDYNAVLPNVGFTFNLTDQVSVFASYAKGISVPGTDVLYNAFYFAPGTDGSSPQPERTDSFDAGLRYRSSTLQAQVGGFYTTFENRIATAFDAELGENVSRNIGEVTRWGFDGSISWQPIPQVLAYVFGSYLNSEIQDDLLGGTCSQTLINQQAYGCTATTQQYFFPTGGKQESGVSEYSFGGRLQASLGPVDIGAQYKRTGPRYINDSNLPLVSRVFTAAVPATATAPARPASVTVSELYSAKTQAYDIVDLDARLSLRDVGLENTYLQLNVSNLFDEFYIGYVSGQTNDTSVPFVQIGVPRTVSGSIVIGF